MVSNMQIVSRQNELCRAINIVSSDFKWILKPYWTKTVKQLLSCKKTFEDTKGLIRRRKSTDSTMTKRQKDQKKNNLQNTIQ